MPGDGSAIKALGSRLRNRGKSNGMRFNPFGLFEAKVVGIIEDTEDPSRLFNDTVYRHLPSGLEVTLHERREVSGTTKSDVQTAVADGVDNTGNFHWPAEQILAHDMISEAQRSIHSTPEDSVQPCVLELGAGVGLAGLLFAKHFPGHRVIVTDGNSGVAAIAGRNLARQSSKAAPVPKEEGVVPLEALNEARALAGQLQWHRFDEALARLPWLLDEVDHIVGADCLFFDQFHGDLKALLLQFLRHSRSNGRSPPRVTLFAPTRGTTMSRFVDLMASEPDVKVDVLSHYDAHISEVHHRLVESKHEEYNPDRHFPHKIVIKRVP